MFLTPPPPKLPSSFGSLPLIVGLALIPLVVATLASVPAIMILPLMPSGWPRVEKQLAMLASWTIAILRNSPSLSGAREVDTSLD